MRFLLKHCQIFYFLTFIPLILFHTVLLCFKNAALFTKTCRQPNLVTTLFIVIFYFSFSEIVHALPDGNPAYYCSRFPGGHDAKTSEGDNGYYIEVRDAVTKLVVSEFIPSKKYEGIPTISTQVEYWPFSTTSKDWGYEWTQFPLIFPPLNRNFAPLIPSLIFRGVTFTPYCFQP